MYECEVVKLPEKTHWLNFYQVGDKIDVSNFHAKNLAKKGYVKLLLEYQNSRRKKICKECGAISFTAPKKRYKQ